MSESPTLQVSPLSVSIVYVYPMNCCPLRLPGEYANYALRFVHTYNQFRPSLPHESIIVINNGRINSEAVCLFSSLPNVRFIEHDNTGLDIGAFQKASLTCTSDIIVFFGATAYFRVGGWMERMVNACMQHGPAVYGAMGNNGDVTRGGHAYPHLRTNGFWLSPALMNRYPKKVISPEDRYPFEHGPDGLTSWAFSQKIQVFEITKNMDLPFGSWGADPNGFHRGDQSSLLVGDRLSEPPYYYTS